MAIFSIFLLTYPTFVLQHFECLIALEHEIILLLCTLYHAFQFEATLNILTFQNGSTHHHFWIITSGQKVCK